jgi:ferric-dicitrate binding protein FerR (iron transport regulator)
MQGMQGDEEGDVKRDEATSSGGRPSSQQERAALRREVAELTFRLCDGSVDRVDLDRLDALLASDDAACRVYAAAKRLHFTLEERAGRVRSMRPEEPHRRTALVAPPRAESRGSSGRRRFVAIAAVLLVGVVSIALTLALWLSREPVLALVSAASGTLEGGARVTVKDRLAAGPFRLSDGWAELTFATGAQVRLTGRSSCEILSKQGVRLDEGQLEARVPLTAPSFSVRTSDVEVIDVGTNISVVRHGAGTEVHVIDGEARTLAAMEPSGDGELPNRDERPGGGERILTARQAVRFGRRLAGSDPAAGATIRLSGGGLRLVDEAGAFRPENLAPSGRPFALDELRYVKDENSPMIHFVGDLNDRRYGNADSWIGGGATLRGLAWAGIDFGDTVHEIAEIAFGRDNEGKFSDRTLGRFRLQYTMVPHAADRVELELTEEPSTGWTTIGELSYETVPGVDFSHLALRHHFRFDAIEARAVRLVVPLSGLSGGAAIDEIELYGPATP